MPSSPKDTTTRNGEADSPVNHNHNNNNNSNITTISKSSPPPPPSAAATATKGDDAVKTEAASTIKAEPLAPPPRPEPTAVASQTPDYFQSSHLSTEANPFEFSFGGGNSANGNGTETPGGTKLPSVAALTSPALGQTPNFWGGLRSGPLSPAMLSGPQRGDDYFSDSHHLRGGFPTPNESSLRSGLTPGGGGSMFPELTPTGGSNTGISQFLGGGATPNTIDFHRTAMKAASAIQRDTAPHSQGVTSQPQEHSSMDVKPTLSGGFDQHDANDAANGLYLLANQSQQARGAQPPPSMYTVAPQTNGMMAHAHPQMMALNSMPQNGSTPNLAHRPNGSISTNSGRGMSEMSGGSDENDSAGRPNTRNKGKRSSTQMTQGSSRGSVDTPSKPSAGKKKKGNNAIAMAMEPEPESEEEPDMSKDGYHANGKKMTDEEKRKNFLERNRVAALKCRQRKKQWLQNLQQKVEVYTTENDALTQQISSLRDEILNLRTVLAAHKDCSVSHQQGLQGHLQHQDMMNGYGAQNPYGMAAAMNQQQQQQLMAGQTRRYS